MNFSIYFLYPIVHTQPHSHISASAYPWKMGTGVLARNPISRKGRRCSPPAAHCRRPLTVHSQIRSCCVTRWLRYNAFYRGCSFKVDPNWFRPLGLGFCRLSLLRCHAFFCGRAFVSCHELVCCHELICCQRCVCFNYFVHIVPSSVVVPCFVHFPSFERALWRPAACIAW